MARALDPDRLADATRNGAPLAALYTLVGDEPLLVTEAMDALRAAARAAGHTERTTLVMDARADWSAPLAALQTLSLFGDKRLLEIKLPTGKPGKTGADTLVKLAEQLGGSSGGEAQDSIAVIGLPRLDKATRESRWMQALMRNGVTVDVPSIDRAQLPAWIRQRLARQNQRTDEATLQWMADKVEGNLLAAHQEIQKLALLYPEGELAGEEVERAVLNVARYDVFALREAMLAGDAPRVIRMLEGLRAEGEALPLVLWAIGEEIRILACLATARDLNAAMRASRIFGARERLIKQTLTRVPSKTWPAAVQHAHDVDRLVKGLKTPGRLDDPWAEMARLALRVAVVKSKPAQTAVHNSFA